VVPSQLTSAGGAVVVLDSLCVERSGFHFECVGSALYIDLTQNNPLIAIFRVLIQ